MKTIAKLKILICISANTTKRGITISADLNRQFSHMYKHTQSQLHIDICYYSYHSIHSTHTDDAKIHLRKMCEFHREFSNSFLFLFVTHTHVPYAQKSSIKQTKLVWHSTHYSSFKDIFTSRVTITYFSRRERFYPSHTFYPLQRSKIKL